MLLCLICITFGAITCISTDATSAFLQSPYPDDEVEIIELDSILQERLGFKYGRVRFAMNGLKLSPACWQSYRDRKLVEAGWVKIMDCFWRCSKFRGVVLAVFVDNMYFFGPKAYASDAFESLKDPLKLNIEGQTEDETFIEWDILSISAKYNKHTSELLLEQRDYSTKLVDKFGGRSGKLVKTPLSGTEFVSNCALDVEPSILAANKKQQQELCGSINYLAIGTRPDLVVPLKACSAAAPTDETILNLKRLIRYCRTNRGMIYRPNSAFKIDGQFWIVLGLWADSDWGSLTTPTHRRSLSGILCNLNGNPVHWKSVTQRSVADSASAAEVFAASECTKIGIRLQEFLMRICDVFREALPITVVVPSPLFEDNSGCIKFAANPLGTKGLRHISIRDSVVKNFSELGYIQLVQVPTDKQKANGLTKVLKSSVEQEHFLKQVNLIETSPE